MSKVSEMIEAQELRYELQEEAARAPAAITKPVRRKPRKDMTIDSLEAGIHPLCTQCGERIESAVCVGDACPTLCSRCAAAEKDK